jgi:hypothetical protein
MSNSWIEHVKKFAKDNNLSYGCALTDAKCKSAYNKQPSSKSKKKTDCKTCKMNKKTHEVQLNEKYTKEQLLIMAKNVVSTMTGSDQYLSSYDKSWDKKSKEDLLKIVSNFKKKYPDMSIKKTPIKMGVLELLG